MFGTQGGGVNGATYLNSRESFLANVDKYPLADGTVLMEIDFMLTADRKVVCTHDFDHMAGYSDDHRPTLAAFEASVRYPGEGDYHGMTLTWLVAQLNERPYVKVVFDTKESNSYDILKVMLDYADSQNCNLRERMIVQVYSYDDYDNLQKLNFQEYWFTNYKAGYDAATIEKYFGDKDNLTTLVMWHYLWSDWYQHGFKTDKKIAIHSLQRDDLTTIAYAFAHGVNYIYID